MPSPRYPVFTEDEISAIRAAAYQTWESVGYDCLQALAEEKGTPIEAVHYQKRDVLEIVLDADRLTSRLTPGVREKFEALTYAQMKRLVSPAFPYRTYGL